MYLFGEMDYQIWISEQLAFEYLKTFYNRLFVSYNL